MKDELINFLLKRDADTNTFLQYLASEIQESENVEIAATSARWERPGPRPPKS